MFPNKKLKPKRANGGTYKFNDSQIMEVDDEREAALEMMGDITNLNMKYELFCKWLQQNGQNSALPDDREVNSSTLLTEDEVSSLHDDSDSDVFLDSESNFPSITILSSDNDEQMPVNVDGVDSLLLGEFRVDTPSQLSVSDYDCSSSDITVNSKQSGSSSQLAKRKAKHKKGKAPPIPITLHKSTNNLNENSCKDLTNTESTTNTPSHMRSAVETDI